MSDLDFNKVYDNSQVVCYQKCPMAYYLQYVKGLVKSDSKESSTLHIDFGSHFHKFLELFYDREMKGGKEPINVNEIWSTFEDREDEAVKTRRNGERLCLAYVENYKGQDRFEILEVEKSRVFDLGDYKFIVKRDAVVRESGNVFSFEHKTTGSLGPWYFDNYFIDSQMDAQTYVTGLDYGFCSGVLLNVAEPKWIEKNVLLRPDDPNVKLYSEVEIKYSSYHKYKCEMAYCKGFRSNFARDIVSRSEGEIEQWKNNTIGWIEKIEESKKKGEWLRSGSGWGCSRCQYKEICKVSKGIKVDESMTEIMYEEIDPYGYLKEGV